MSFSKVMLQTARAGGFALIVLLVVEGCGSGSPRFMTKETSPSPAGTVESYQLEGVASYYAEDFDGKTTANGEVYDMHGLTAAHRTLPFGTKVRVVNKETGRSVVVRINDRGPFKDDRVIDLSLGAATQLGIIPTGTARVLLEVLEMGTSSK
jgi:rare lipoprotein A